MQFFKRFAVWPAAKAFPSAGVVVFGIARHTPERHAVGKEHRRLGYVVDIYRHAVIAARAHRGVEDHRHGEHVEPEARRLSPHRRRLKIGTSSGVGSDPKIPVR